MYRYRIPVLFRLAVVVCFLRAIFRQDNRIVGMERQ